jgi:hypothetical protein
MSIVRLPKRREISQKIDENHMVGSLKRADKKD